MNSRAVKIQEKATTWKVWRILTRSRFTMTFPGVPDRHFSAGLTTETEISGFEDRLRKPVGILAIEICNFASLDNYLHVLLRLKAGSDESQSVAC